MATVRKYSRQGDLAETWTVGKSGPIDWIGGDQFLGSTGPYVAKVAVRPGTGAVNVINVYTFGIGVPARTLFGVAACGNSIWVLARANSAPPHNRMSITKLPVDATDGGHSQFSFIFSNNNQRRGLCTPRNYFAEDGSGNEWGEDGNLITTYRPGNPDSIEFLGARGGGSLSTNNLVQLAAANTVNDICYEGGGEYWIVAEDSGGICAKVGSDGSVISSFSTVGATPEGVTFNGEFLYTSEA